MIKEACERPNLFSYATSELSQDAALAWLAAWAHPDHKSKNQKLHEQGIRFIEKLLDKSGQKLSKADLKLLEVSTQADRVDVHIKIGDELCILIEDKTNSPVHGDQLKVYLKNARDAARKEEHPKRVIVPIFLKTGNEFGSSEQYIDGWHRFSRNDLIEVLVEDSGNAISDDFRAHLVAIELATNQYKESPVDSLHAKDVDWRMIEGFYMWLEGEKIGTSQELIQWRYVSNQSGGFIGGWWNFVSCGKDLMIYLQLNHAKELQIRLIYGDRNQRKVGWDERAAVEKVTQGLMASNATKFDDLKLCRPKRYGSGNSAAVRTIKLKDDTDFPARDADGKLDEERTLNLLTLAEQLVNETAEQLNKEFSLGN